LVEKLEADWLCVSSMRTQAGFSVGDSQSAVAAHGIEVSFIPPALKAHPVIIIPFE
jgi:hypothetical protein